MVLTPRVGGAAGDDLHGELCVKSLGKVVSVVKGEEPKWVVK